MINDNFIEIRDKLFKGDLGKENQIQNDSILALMIRQDAIVNSMTATHKAKYDTTMENFLEFTDKVKNEAIESYKAKMALLGKKSIFEVEELDSTDETTETFINPTPTI